MSPFSKSDAKPDVSITMFAVVVKAPTRSENKIVAACDCAQQFWGHKVGFDICVQASEVPPGAWTFVFRFFIDSFQYFTNNAFLAGN